MIERNLGILCAHLDTLTGRYRWEMVLIDDGSTDGTGDLLECFARGRANVRVYRHATNFGMGQALKFGFNVCRGDYVVTFDADLSYAPSYVATLVDKMVESGAKIVVASPYMKGGSVSNVPWPRRLASFWANRYLSTAANARVATLTGMVRAYDARFLGSLSLRSMGMEFNADVIRQAQILRARIVEIPADLAWPKPAPDAPERRSAMRTVPYARDVLIATFLFRPVMHFALPGVAALTVAALAAARRRKAVANIAALAGIELLGLAALSLQTKRSHEDLFNLLTTVYKEVKENRS
jgi:hypothetical protein